jgi:uncharacterized protein YodC (DUF2158 family)
MKVGDTVRMKADGSPLMTIEGFLRFSDEDCRLADCIWFDAEQHLQRGRFDVKALELHETT